MGDVSVVGTDDDRRISPHPLQASCLCGAVQWRLEGKVVLNQICVCHCGMCRRMSGSTHIPFAAVERKRLWPLIRDRPTLQAYESSKGCTTRFFCNVCSSPIVFDYHFQPNTLWVPLGTVVGSDSNASIEVEEDASIGSSHPDLDPTLLDTTRDSQIYCNDRAGYEDALDSKLNRLDSFGLYKEDPCRRGEKWSDRPTYVESVKKSALPNWKDLPKVE